MSDDIETPAMLEAVITVRFPASAVDHVERKGAPLEAKDIAGVAQAQWFTGQLDVAELLSREDGQVRVVIRPAAA